MAGTQAMEDGVRIAKETAYEEHSVFAPEVLYEGAMISSAMFNPILVYMES